MLLFAYVWRYRWHLLLPMLLCPIAAGLLMMGQPQTFTATTTLHLDPTTIRSPLLSNLSEPNHQSILLRALTSKGVLNDTLNEMGVVLDGMGPQEQALKRQDLARHIDMQVLGNGLIRIDLHSEDANSIEDVLAALSFNFIQEILAPERFRLDQQLNTLEQQIKAYAERAKDAAGKLAELNEDKAAVNAVVAAEFEVQRLEAQRKLAQAEYDDLLSRQKTFFNPFDRNDPSTIMWFVEPPVLKAVPAPVEQQRLIIAAGVPAGLLIGLLLVLLARVNDRSLRHPLQAQKYLGYPVLGQVPNLGPVSLTRGRLTIDMTKS